MCYLCPRVSVHKIWGQYIAWWMDYLGKPAPFPAGGEGCGKVLAQPNPFWDWLWFGTTCWWLFALTWLLMVMTGSLGLQGSSRILEISQVSWYPFCWASYGGLGWKTTGHAVTCFTQSASKGSVTCLSLIFLGPPLPSVFLLSFQNCGLLYLRA